MKSLPKVKLGRYYLLQFGFTYPYLAPQNTICPYLALLTYIWLYLGLITHIGPLRMEILHLKMWGIQVSSANAGC